jgi:hypothetical protein
MKADGACSRSSFFRFATRTWQTILHGALVDASPRPARAAPTVVSGVANPSIPQYHRLQLHLTRLRTRSSIGTMPLRCARSHAIVTGPKARCSRVKLPPVRRTGWPKAAGRRNTDGV